MRFCDVENEDTGARCCKSPNHGRSNHYGFAHWPGQLVSWPSATLVLEDGQEVAPD